MLITKDLEDSETFVNSCFPPEYKILIFLFETYENELKRFILKIIEHFDEVNSGDLLFLGKIIC
jgi:hypothetical protein